MPTLPFILIPPYTMSNPSKAPTSAMTPQQVKLGRGPQCYYSLVVPPGPKPGAIPVMTEALQDLDMQVLKTWYVPRQMTVDPQVHASKGDVLARAQNGMAAPRQRCAQGQELVNLMHESIKNPFLQLLVKERCEACCYWDVGAEWTLGRLQMHYPKKDSTIPSPITRAEALAAVRNQGLDFGWAPKSMVVAHTLIPMARAGEDPRALTINQKASTGFPVLGKMEDEAAASLVFSLAMTIREEVSRALFEGGPPAVLAWKRAKEKGMPWLVDAQGRGKNDHYKGEKIGRKEARFYNALPKQVLMVIQQATQPAVELARNIFHDPDLHSASGISLAHGGAHKLVLALEYQVEQRGYGWVNMGDDTWLAFRGRDGRLYFLSIDATAFDLTQHRDLTLEPHLALRDEFRRFDGVAAELWYCFMRDRTVVTAGTLRRRWLHGGPSGMAGQDKVNGVVMDVYLQRLVRVLDGMERLEQATVGRAVEMIGEGMGLKMRLEQYACGSTGLFRDLLTETPFLFIGYDFYYSGERLAYVCHADLPRTISQLAYNKRYLRAKGGEFEVGTAIRLASVVLNLGVFPPELQEMHAAAVDYTLELLEDVRRKYRDEYEDLAAWCDEGAPWGFSITPTLSGYINALEQPPRDHWVVPKQVADVKEDDGVGYPAPVHSPALANWADLEDELDGEFLKEIGVLPPPLPLQPIGLIRDLVGRTPAVASTHPPSLKNDGRPPPTVTWGADKPPRPRYHPMALRSRRYGGQVQQEDVDTDEYYEYEQREEQDDRPAYDPNEGEEVDEEAYIDSRLRIAKRDARFFI